MMNQPPKPEQTGSQAHPESSPAISGPYLPGSAAPSERPTDQRRPLVAAQQSAFSQSGVQNSTKPSQNLNSPPSPHICIEQRSRKLWPIILSIITALALVTALIWFGTRPEDSTSNSSGASPSKSHTTSAPARTPTPGTQAIEVVFPNEEGKPGEAWWEILNVTWDTTGVNLDLRITVSRGNLSYHLFALDNKTAEQYKPTPTSQNPLYPGRVQSSESKRGIVRFEKSRGDTTIVMSSPNGTALAALAIKG